MKEIIKGNLLEEWIEGNVMKEWIKEKARKERIKFESHCGKKTIFLIINICMKIIIMIHNFIDIKTLWLMHYSVLFILMLMCIENDYSFAILRVFLIFGYNQSIDTHHKIISMEYWEQPHHQANQLCILNIDFKSIQHLVSNVLISPTNVSKIPRGGRFCENNFLELLVGSQPIIEGRSLIWGKVGST